MQNRRYKYQSPYMNSTVGSDVVTVSYGERRWEYDFENNTATETTGINQEARR